MPTARELITRSWYLSGIESRELQSVGGDRLAVGLELLKSLLDYAQAETELIPYYNLNEATTTVIDQEKYFIENCAEIAGVSFDLNDVRFNMQRIPHNQYFSASRVNNLTSLPFTFSSLRTPGGTDLYLYPLPDDTFNLNIFGKFYITDPTLSTELNDTFDKAYTEYLRYALAEYMCQEYGCSLPPNAYRRYKEVKAKLKKFSSIDPTVRKAGLNTGNASLPPQVLSLYTGWLP